MSILDEPGFDANEEKELEAQMRAPVEEPKVEEVEETVEEAFVEDEKEEVQPVPTVPLSALNEARHANRQLKSELSQVKEQLQSLAKIREELEEFRNRQKAQSDQDTFAKDPLGVLREEIQSLKKTQLEAETTRSKQAQEEQQSRQLEQLVATRVQEFTKTAPDYSQALEHLLSSRANELKMLGASEEQVEALIARESMELAKNSITSGMNPAEVVYNLAKMRGYAPKAAEKEKIVTIERGQKASKSLADAPGGAPEISLTDIDRMSEEEFDKYWDEKVAGKKR